MKVKSFSSAKVAYMYDSVKQTFHESDRNTLIYILRQTNSATMKGKSDQKLQFRLYNK